MLFYSSRQKCDFLSWDSPKKSKKSKNSRPKDSKHNDVRFMRVFCKRKDFNFDYFIQYDLQWDFMDRTDKIPAFIQGIDKYFCQDEMYHDFKTSVRCQNFILFRSILRTTLKNFPFSFEEILGFNEYDCFTILSSLSWEHFKTELGSKILLNNQFVHSTRKFLNDRTDQFIMKTLKENVLFIKSSKLPPHIICKNPQLKWNVKIVYDIYDIFIYWNQFMTERHILIIDEYSGTSDPNSLISNNSINSSDKPHQFYKGFTFLLFEILPKEKINDMFYIGLFTIIQNKIKNGLSYDQFIELLPQIIKKMKLLSIPLDLLETFEFMFSIEDVKNSKYSYLSNVFKI